MKERPIFFSAPMVRSLLDGSKTQTRRVLKVQSPHWKRVVHVLVARLAAVISCKQPVDAAWVGFDVGSPSGPHYYKCPYGQPGDQLWVREAWRIDAWNEDKGKVGIDYLADGFSRREWIQVPEKSDFERYWIQSTDDAMKAGLATNDDGKYHWEAGQSPCRGRPSIHMPRWASRITLEIVNMEVERLHDISWDDARAEGWNPLAEDGKNPAPLDPKSWYRNLWESINSPGSWDLNPWVWVIEFKRIN